MAREAYVVFWSLALAAVLTAFVVMGVAWDVVSSRHLAGAFLALAALVPVLLASRPRARLLVACGVGAYAAMSLGAHVARGVGTWSVGGDLREPAAQLADYARANGLEFGYAGYYDAPVVTWLQDERVKVFPVVECDTRLCPYGAHTISSWYRPRPAVRTFLVTHPLAKRGVLTAPYARAGTPVDTRRFGSLTVYVYDHDIAADLGPGGVQDQGSPTRP
jgi:hypothetical protein